VRLRVLPGVAVKPEQELSVTKRERQRDEYAAESHTMHDAASGEQEPEDGWRVLPIGEVIRAGDEFLAHCQWHAAAVAGLKIFPGFPPYRRRITSDHDAAPAAKAIRDAALALYEVGQWVSPDVPAAQADAMWATLRDALGLPVGHATARGVAAAPPAGSVTLTDEEREAMKRTIGWLSTIATQRGDIHTAQYVLDDAATLRGLLARATKEEAR